MMFDAQGSVCGDGGGGGGGRGWHSNVVEHVFPLNLDVSQRKIGVYVITIAPEFDRPFYNITVGLPAKFQRDINILTQILRVLTIRPLVRY